MLCPEAAEALGVDRVQIGKSANYTDGTGIRAVQGNRVGFQHRGFSGLRTGQQIYELHEAVAWNNGDLKDAFSHPRGMQCVFARDSRILVLGFKDQGSINVLAPVQNLRHHDGRTLLVGVVVQQICAKQLVRSPVTNDLMSYQAI